MFSEQAEGWLHVTVNALNATESLTLKCSSLCYVDLSSAFIKASSV